MPENNIWPPKPTLLDPMAEYDELIEARLPTLSAMTVKWDLIVPASHKLLPGIFWLLPRVHRLSPGVPVNDRALLIQVLREECGLDFQQAQSVVLSYYQRRGMAMTTKAVLRTLVFPLTVLALAFVGAFAVLISSYLTFHRDAVLSQPNHGAALIALDHAKALLQIASLTLSGLVFASWFVRYWVMRRRSKRPQVEIRG